MSRWKAAGIHLLLSCVAVGAVLAFMVTVWYRWPLFAIGGGSGIILILAGVQGTLGPLLTLVIFKPGKRGLKFDLIFIALIQLAALAYGIYVAFVARPVYLVLAVDRFVLVTARDLDPDDLARATDPRFTRLPLGSPPYIAAVLPTDQKERSDLLFSALAGKDVELYPRYYAPYESQAQNALGRARDIGILMKRDARTIERFLESEGRSPASVKFLPLRAREDASVLLDAASGIPIGIVRIDPW